MNKMKFVTLTKLIPKDVTTDLGSESEELKREREIKRLISNGDDYDDDPQMLKFTISVGRWEEAPLKVLDGLFETIEKVDEGTLVCLANNKEYIVAESVEEVERLVYGV